MTPHQIEMVKIIETFADGEEFRVKDVRARGYPHKDAAAVLQQDRVLLTFLSYASEEYKNGAIYYTKNKNFDYMYNVLVGAQT